MCTLSPRLEYKLPKGRTWVFQLSPRRVQDPGLGGPSLREGLVSEWGAGEGRRQASSKESVKNAGEQSSSVIARAE